MKLGKYLKLYGSFFRASAMSDLEYRLNIVTKIFTDLLWYTAQASVFEVLFRHAPQISGWDIHSARVFMAMLFIVDAIWMVLFHENFERLSWKVKRGELDLVLVKPLDSQFILTLQKQNTSYVVNIVLTFIYLFWALAQVPQSIGVLNVAAMVFIGLPVGIAICYCFRLMFAVLAVIFSQAESVNYVWYQIYRLGMRPDTFYPIWLRLLILTFLPVGFIASVPAQMLLRPLEWWMILGGPAVALLLLWISRVVWIRSLKHYSSASS